jgi:uridine kinase
MGIGISGTHGTGKTTLAEQLRARLPGHALTEEPYYLLELSGSLDGRVAAVLAAPGQPAS